jgi:hypothetical protein
MWMMRWMAFLNQVFVPTIDDGVKSVTNITNSWLCSTMTMRKIVTFLALLVLTSNVHGFSLNRRATPNKSGETRLKSDGDDEEPWENNGRRDVLRVALAGFSGLSMMPSSSSAGEVGTMMNKAVTTSDLGIAVRTQVVKGAQVMDKLDGSWEKLSDRFNLGSERSKEIGNRPVKKVIPDPLPLDVATAKSILDTSDSVFSSVTGISGRDLQQQIEKVAKLVKPSFERSGLSLDDPLTFKNGPQFNFASYVHFKAYTDLILERKIAFGLFRSKFEPQVGERLVALLLPGFSRPEVVKSRSPEENRRRVGTTALDAADRLSQIIVAKGLVAAIDRSKIEKDDFDDWVEDLSDLQFSVALDGDITLQSQILLQEQGFRLYPNFARFAIAYLMQQDGQQLSVMDYYFDTDYNSDPDKFEVKEVLLNVVLESQ